MLDLIGQPQSAPHRLRGMRQAWDREEVGIFPNLCYVSAEGATWRIVATWEKLTLKETEGGRATKRWLVCWLLVFGRAAQIRILFSGSCRNAQGFFAEPLCRGALPSSVDRSERLSWLVTFSDRGKEDSEMHPGRFWKSEMTYQDMQGYLLAGIHVLRLGLEAILVSEISDGVGCSVAAYQPFREGRQHVQERICLRFRSDFRRFENCHDWSDGVWCGEIGLFRNCEHHEIIRLPPIASDRFIDVGRSPYPPLVETLTSLVAANTYVEVIKAASTTRPTMPPSRARVEPLPPRPPRP